MNPTIRLLRVVGSPFVPDTDSPKNVSETRELYYCALKNRMTLLYLSILNKQGKLGSLKKRYEEMNENSLETYDAIFRASETLRRASVAHSIFKTIRPYLATTVDIDVLILEQDRKFQRAVAEMTEAGYRLLKTGPLSTTLMDPYMDMGVDLYREVGISHVIYLDKDEFTPEMMVKTTLPNGKSVTTFSPPADLVALIAHSLYKEHIYTLSEYYTTIHYLDQMSSSEIGELLELIHNHAITNAARVHLTITAYLHKLAHGSLPDKIDRIIEEIGIDALEIRNLERNFITPHKFHPLTLLTILSEKMRREAKVRRSVIEQMIRMFDLNFAGDFIRDVMQHVKRQTY